eukprot:COSAG06_NODE_864_length_11873_cov_16.077374_5_plen_59_part_00
MLLMTQPRGSVNAKAVIPTVVGVGTNVVELAWTVAVGFNFTFTRLLSIQCIMHLYQVR